MVVKVRRRDRSVATLLFALMLNVIVVVSVVAFVVIVALIHLHPTAAACNAPLALARA